MIKRFGDLIVIVVICIAVCQTIQAQVDGARIDQLEAEVERLRSDVNEIEDDVSNGLILFLFGVVCALWAQNTGRNAWSWFFLGLFFSVITVLFLLYKNSQDRRMSSSP